MTKLNTTFFSLLVLTLLLSSCGISKKASKSFKRGFFQSSIDLYRKVLAKKPNDPDANFYVAESYRQSNRVPQSEEYYKRAIEGGVENDSLLVFYADALKSAGKYAEAKKQLEQYLQNAQNVDPLNSKFVMMAQEAYDNMDKLEAVQQKKNYYKVKNLDAINTSGIEYSPIYNDGELYFTTSQKSSKIFYGTGTPFTGIFKVKTRGARVNMSSMQPIGNIINTDDAHEASVTFSPDGKTIVFARSTNGKKKDVIDEVSLFTSRLRNGKWTQPRMLSNGVNVPGTWTSSPAFSRDGKTLYFASNRKRPDGATDVDIYSA
ncbi:MAG: tetratricopeptide repeat protein, partial [Bacteroidota bacterium]